MTNKQPEALRLAARLREGYSNLRKDLEPSAAELERLHYRVQELEAWINPLTEDWIETLFKESELECLSSDDVEAAIGFARAIERAHGINQSTPAIEEIGK